VEDAALLLNLIAGYDELDPTTSKRPVADYLASLGTDLSGLRIGVPRTKFYERCDDEISKTVLSGISVLEELGCVISEIDLPCIPEIMAMHSCIEACEQSANHLQAMLERPEEYAPDVRSIIERGLFIPVVYYIQALRLRSTVAPNIFNIFSHVNAIIIPSQPFLAPAFDFAEHGLIEEDLTYTAPFNLIGLPALSVPCGFSRTGLPIGMQIIGDAFDEGSILRIGNAYEHATKWYRKAPELAFM
jgi:aspartyl-tRNA(Asn)/glutamyl-tRNA(Gln) amidotransferase subunit A